MYFLGDSPVSPFLKVSVDESMHDKSTRGKTVVSFEKPKVKRRYYRHQSSHLFDEKILVKISAIHKKYIKINLQTILKGSAKSQI